MVSIIIPCYNEEKCIKKSVTEIINYMNDEKIDYELICVNDGSTDNTKKILENINTIKLISYDENMGKGYAVKQGILAASGEKIIFMDADLSTDLSAIKKGLKRNEDIVIGSRALKNSIILDKPLMRKISSFISNKIITLMIGTNIKDTQCGFKIFKSDIIKQIVEKQTINRWAFDVEYIYIAKLNHYSVKEIPVIWKNNNDSKVRLIKDSINFIKELIKIRKNKSKYV